MSQTDEFRQIPNENGYTINKQCVVKKNDEIINPRKDGYIAVGGRVRLPKKLMLEAFPELIPGKQIKDFTLYYITEDGNIFSLKKCKFMSIQKRRRNNSDKFDKTIVLYKEDGTRKPYPKLVHRLVAETYLPNPDNLPEVNHKDGNPENNHVDNLEWISKVDNTKHAVENYLFEGQQKSVKAYKDMNDEPMIFKSMKQAADVLGFKSRNANKNISECCQKNQSGKLNRGKPTSENPFRTEGYAFWYNND